MKLEGKNLTFSYDKQGQAVFRQVNLCLDNTEKAALMGPSGF